MVILQNPVHPGRRRAVLGPESQMVDRFGRTGDHRLDAPVMAVANPPAKAKRPGFVPQGPTKSDALDPAFDQQMAYTGTHETLSSLNGHQAVSQPGYPASTAVESADNPG